QVDLGHVAGEFLPQGERHRVHQVSAADLDDGGELGGLGGERVAQRLGGRQQAVRHLLDGGDVHGGGEGVVGRLRLVDVVVGLDRLLAAHLTAGQLDGPVGDHLVGVHVGLRAAAGLPDAQREVAVELAGDDLVGGPDD